MVKALVEITDSTNRVLNVVKAKYDLKNKGEAIDWVVLESEENDLDRELRPEMIEKLKIAQKGPFRRIKSLDELLK